MIDRGSVDGLPVRERCLVMGVVNVTPDSFSDGGSYFETSTAVEHGLSLAAQGADADLRAPADDPAPAPTVRDDATAAVTALAAAAGAFCVRVHDVASSLDAVRVAAAWSHEPRSRATTRWQPAAKPRRQHSTLPATSQHT
jgi:dihydropteroate synthase